MISYINENIPIEKIKNFEGKMSFLKKKIALEKPNCFGKDIEQLVQEEKNKNINNTNVPLILSISIDSLRNSQKVFEGTDNK